MIDRLPTSREYQARYSVRVLEAHNWNKAAACAVLDISYHTLNGHLDLLGVPRNRPAVAAATDDPEVDALLEQTAKQIADLDAVKVMYDAQVAQ